MKKNIQIEIIIQINTHTAPKRQHITAQGSALGICPNHISALKGRNNITAAQSQYHHPYNIPDPPLQTEQFPSPDLQHTVGR